MPADSILRSWGQSAGSISVSLHLLTNGGDTEGLFQAAIMESGSPTSLVDTPVEAQQFYDALVQGLGCANSTDTLNCLRQVPFASLKAAVDMTPSLYSRTVRNS